MKIREKAIVRPGRYTEYRYLARFGRIWVDLSRWGNRIPPRKDRDEWLLKNSPSKS